MVKGGPRPVHVRAALRTTRARMKPAEPAVKDLNLSFGKSSRAQSKSRYWTNASVLALAAEREPVDTIAEEARKAILEFTEAGGSVRRLIPSRSRSLEESVLSPEMMYVTLERNTSAAESS